MEKTKQQEMFAIIEASLQITGSIKEFIAQSSITSATFYYWKKKYQTIQQSDTPKGFIPIKPVNKTDCTIEIQYPHGQTVKVRGPNAIETVRALVGY